MMELANFGSYILEVENKFQKTEPAVLSLFSLSPYFVKRVVLLSRFLHQHTTHTKQNTKQEKIIMSFFAVKIEPGLSFKLDVDEPFRITNVPLHSHFSAHFKN